jgi:hypothetical protein
MLKWDMAYSKVDKKKTEGKKRGGNEEKRVLYGKEELQ